MRRGFRPEGMFLRMCDDGADFTNCHHGHAFTKTAPGHSVQLTGAFPHTNGIINNDWFDPTVTWGKKPGEMYCVADPAVQIVGGVTEDVGRSPKNLLVDTLGDVLKLTRPGSRVFGLSLKDRAAILMSGHAADGAYWLEGGKWVTSTYYRRDLPPYMRLLNEQNADQAFLGKTWTLLYPLEQYTLHYPDDAAFEGQLPGSGRGFPHQLPDKPGKASYTAMTTSPFGNDYTLQTARAFVEAERLGKRGFTDLLTLNLSSNDYVGHTFGPHSLEVQDITFRTDRQLGAFAAFIEKYLDGAPWVLAITSDHGVAPIPEFAVTLKLPAGRGKFKLAEVQQKIEAALVQAFGKPSHNGKYVRKMDEGDVYLDPGAARTAGRTPARGRAHRAQGAAGRTASRRGLHAARLAQPTRRARSGLAIPTRLSSRAQRRRIVCLEAVPRSHGSRRHARQPLGIRQPRAAADPRGRGSPRPVRNGRDSGSPRPDAGEAAQFRAAGRLRSRGPERGAAPSVGDQASTSRIVNWRPIIHSQ